jgi:hypothetical protein
MLDYETSRDDKQYREMVDKVFTALDSKNKEALKGLFASNVIKSNKEIDEQINDLFQFYKGPKESDEDVDLVYSDEYNDYGVKEIFLGNSFTVTAAGVKYNVCIEMYSRNDNDKGEEGIQVLEFATEEAKNSKYFMWHSKDSGDIPGVYVQTSAEKRSDIMMVDSNLMKYTSIKRTLRAEDFLAFVKKDDNFGRLTDVIGKANGSNTNFGMYYYELGNNQYIVCSVENDKIKYIYTANEDKEIKTLWIADDMMKVQGAYIHYTPIDRKLTEDKFKSFLALSNSFEKLVDEIGQPNGEDYYSYYRISDNRFAVCHCTGDEIQSVYIADAENKLYTLWGK